MYKIQINRFYGFFYVFSYSYIFLLADILMNLINLSNYIAMYVAVL